MVKVTIEILAFGNEKSDHRRTIGIIEIANDVTGTPEKGNYNVKLKHAGKYFGKKGNWKTGKVKGHRRSLSPYHLVMKAIQAALGKEQ